jgi:hypothetical protein
MKTIRIIGLKNFNTDTRKALIFFRYETKKELQFQAIWVEYGFQAPDCLTSFIVDIEEPTIKELEEIAYTTIRGILWNYR